MINVWGTMLDREIIHEEISPKYPRMIELLNEELDTIKVSKLFCNNSITTQNILCTLKCR